MWKVRRSSSGIHLFDRSSGANVLFDEIIPDEQTWSTSPRHVSIALTNKCDLACSHCYAPKHRSCLNVETVKQWLLEIDQNGSLGVGFGGGEPALYPHLDDLCQFAQTETELSVSMTSHGHLLQPDILSSINFLRVSMDGVGEVYEAIRGRAFDDFLNVLSFLKNEVAFGINFVVNSETYHCLDEAVNLAERYGAKEFLLLPEVEFGSGTGICETTRKCLSDWINEYRGDIPLSISQGNHVGFSVCDPCGSNKLDDYVHIDADGVLKRSSFESSGIQIEGSFINALDELNKLEATQ